MNESMRIALAQYLEDSPDREPPTFGDTYYGRLVALGDEEEPLCLYEVDGDHARDVLGLVENGQTWVYHSGKGVFEKCYVNGDYVSPIPGTAFVA